eukprot:scaffold17785_cov54-Phaeocystis_antarctica.AAC.2
MYGDPLQAFPWRVHGFHPKKGARVYEVGVRASLTLTPTLTDEKVRKFMSQNVEAGSGANAGDNTVSFAEYLEGGSTSGGSRSRRSSSGSQW